MSPLLSLFLVFFISFLHVRAEYNYCQADSTVPVDRSLSGYQLRLVQVFIRHGDRSPMSPLTGNGTRSEEIPWNCTLNFLSHPGISQSSAALSRLYAQSYELGLQQLPGNCAVGQLTSRGGSQHFSLGTNLRQKYVNSLKFLPSTFSSSEMTVRSTDVGRTRLSVQQLLLGFFPPSSATVTLPVIDITTREVDADNMVPNPVLCPLYGVLQNQLTSSNDYLKVLQPYQTVIDAVSARFRYTGSLVDKAHEVIYVSDNFKARECYQAPLPTGITPASVQSINDLNTDTSLFLINSTQLRRLSMGSFVAEVYERLQDVVAGKSQYKMHIYSGHDTTLGPFLNAMGLWDGVQPPYASHVEIELWEKTGAYFVVIYYNGKVQQLPSCSSTVCPFTEFAKIVQPVLPVNYEKECAVATELRMKRLGQSRDSILEGFRF